MCDDIITKDRTGCDDFSATDRAKCDDFDFKRRPSGENDRAEFSETKFRTRCDDDLRRRRRWCRRRCITT